VEREAFAAATLVRAMEEGSLDTAPIWSDLRTFDALAWRGAVDLVVAGFPCQPVSCAGLRRAQRDERWLWPSVARCVRDSGSWGVFLENVPGIVNRGMADVLEDLAGLGFSAEWDLLSAEDVGAPHRRVRWWCLAANADRLRVLADEKQPEGHGKADADTRRNGAHGSVADAVVRDGGGIPRRGEAQESAGGPPSREEHFATFPIDLPRLCLRASVSERGGCAECGAPRRRVVSKGAVNVDQQRAMGGDRNGHYNGHATKDYGSAGAQDPARVKARILAAQRSRSTAGWEATCKCGADKSRPCIVLDPFCGTGTTGIAALEMGASFVGIEINPKTAAAARRRLAEVNPLFAREAK